jgi:hypothetical protein
MLVSKNDRLSLLDIDFFLSIWFSWRTIATAFLNRDNPPVFAPLPNFIDCMSTVLVRFAFSAKAEDLCITKGGNSALLLSSSKIDRFFCCSSYVVN